MTSLLLVLLGLLLMGASIAGIGSTEITFTSTPGEGDLDGDGDDDDDDDDDPPNTPGGNDPGGPVPD